MALGQDPPCGCRSAQRVGQGLEDEVSVLGAVAEATERREGQRMRGVVGEIEATLRRKRRVGGIGETYLAGAQQTIELCR